MKADCGWLFAAICFFVFTVWFTNRNRRCVDGTFNHDWIPDGFADYKCSKCGKER